jgi:dihydroorotate dehydrogenase (NAD+) catalytic subunit
MSVMIGRVRLKTPVLTASGTCGYGREYEPYLDMSRLGGFFTKSITVKPRAGNAPQRIVETSGGMLNAIGLANVGLDEFIAVKAPMLKGLGPAVLVNVAGHSVEEYVEVCRRVDELDVIAGVELNVSCPNVADGLLFGTDPPSLEKLVTQVRKVVKRGVLIVKLSPNVTDITKTARAAINGGAEALSLVNTFLGMAIDIHTRRPILANQSGGLSGPAIKPLAVHLVHRVWREVARDARVPLIGLGGIRTWEDAAEFMLAGASAVAVGTALYVDPTTPIKIADGLAEYLRRQGMKSVSQLVGAMAGDGPAQAAADVAGGEG